MDADKIKHAVDDVTGKVKEGLGKATDDHSMQAEGERDQTKADLGRAKDNVKDAFTDR
jgi:uncharacterized protein YjbJ (UPF0337 family)